MVVERDDARETAERVSDPVVVDPIEPGRSITAALTPCAASASAACHAFVISSGPYATSATSSPSRNVTPRPTSSAYDSGSEYGRSSGTFTNRRYVLALFYSIAQRMASRASRSQHGSIAASPGTEPIAEMSRTDWCEWPGPPGTTPASVAV